SDPWFQAIVRFFHLETGLLCAGAMLAGGIGLGAYALGAWSAEKFGELPPAQTMRLVIPSGTLILLGFQLASSAFFCSVLEIRASHRSDGATPNSAGSEAA